MKDEKKKKALDESNDIEAKEKEFDDDFELDEDPKNAEDFGLHPSELQEELNAKREKLKKQFPPREKDCEITTSDIDLEEK